MVIQLESSEEEEEEDEDEEQEQEEGEGEGLPPRHLEAVSATLKKRCNRTRSYLSPHQPSSLFTNITSHELHVTIPKCPFPQ